MASTYVALSGMPRFRLATDLLLVLAMLAVSSSAVGQTPALPEQPLLGSNLNTDLVGELPTSNTPFAVLETIQPEVIGNLFSAGGLNVAARPQFGAFLNSWTQTQIRIGDIAITDPRTGGTPLLLPFRPWWQRMTTTTGAMGVEENASALSLTLEPLRPGTKWLRSVEGSLSAPPLVWETTNPDATGPVPSVDRVQQWRDASFLVSGPLTDRLGLVASGSWSALSHIAASTRGMTRDSVSSGFAHLVFAATPRDEIRALGWVQEASARFLLTLTVPQAALTDRGLHVQTTWERRAPAQLAWRVFGGYTQSTRTADAPTHLAVDSLYSDPVSDLIDPGVGTTRRWTVGARVAPPVARRLPTVGVDLEGAQVRIPATELKQISEFVDGRPARVWNLHPGSGTDVRHVTTLAAHANERLTYRGLTLDAGIRLEALSGAANESAQGIQWTTWLPRVMVRWQIADKPGLALVAGYRRTAYQLPLNLLALGDPAAPVADVSAWNGTSVGPLIARVGPGTGGDPTFARIDPDLQRPTTDELVLAVEARPLPGVEVVLARVTKREEPLLTFADTGLPSSTYSTFQVPDVSFIPGSEDGTPLVTVYNRPPGSYGRDRYLLTNLAAEPARFWGINLNVRVATDRFTILGGGTLTWALGPAAAVGFLPSENDQDVLGNLFVDPNSATLARGQLFPDRSHVVKIAGVYRFPWRVSLGVIARYQDGQPFARLVVVPNLVQGPTAVRAYPNGGSAFTYTGTLDVRVQKVFTRGRSQVAAAVDVYNLPNLGNEVAEYVASGTRFREPTALQPPRTVVVGLRMTF